MFEEEVKHNNRNDWQEGIKKTLENKEEMKPVKVTVESLSKKLAQFPNFKAPGVDKIPNYWLKQITGLHEHYVGSFNRIIEGEEEEPKWLTTRMTTFPKQKKPNFQISTDQYAASAQHINYLQHL